MPPFVASEKMCSCNNIPIFHALIRRVIKSRRDPVENKVEKRLQCWGDKTLPSGGRRMLLNVACKAVKWLDCF